MSVEPPKKKKTCKRCEEYLLIIKSLEDKLKILSGDNDIIIQSEDDENTDEKNDEKISLIVRVDELYEMLGRCRSDSSVIIADIVKIKNKLSKNFTLFEYEDLLEKFFLKFESSSSGRCFSVSQKGTLLSELFTPLDLRLLKNPKYIDCTITPDDIFSLKNIIQSTIIPPSTYIPFKEPSYEIIPETALSILPIKEILMTLLASKVPYQNFVYLPPESYTFYFLNRIDDKKVRRWTQDNRCQNITIDIADKYLPMCVNLFRKIYFDIFNDNVFVKAHIDVASSCFGYNDNKILATEINQLFKNILVLANRAKLRNIIQNIIKQHATISQGEQECFNMVSDDSLLLKTISQEDENFDRNILSQMFDGIDREEKEFLCKVFEKKS